MLIARAPMRVSYAGGGTDIESYYRDFGGIVVSAAIDKYFYVIIKPTSNRHVQVSSADFRAFLRIEGESPIGVGGELNHAKAALARSGVSGGYSVFMASEVPAGTGLGSSSAVAVALVKALLALQGKLPDKTQIAEEACQIELRDLAMPIGRQDQYASSFGGINAIRFDSAGVAVEPLDLDLQTVSRLERCTMLFYTGLLHDSSTLLKQQSPTDGALRDKRIELLHEIKAAACEARDALLSGDPDRIGAILARNWEAKRRLSPDVSNSMIDTAYEAAIQGGASGGKIAGAGGGGFLLLYCKPENQATVAAALHSLGLARTDFHFDFGGARILMNTIHA